MPRRLLLVEDVATNRIVLKAKLTAAGYAVDIAKGEHGALAAISKSLPDVVLISGSVLLNSDGNLPKLFGARQSVGRISIIVLAEENQKHAANEFIDAVIPPAYPDGLFLARLRSVIRMRDLHAELAMRTQTYRELGFAEAPVPFAQEATVIIAQDGPNFLKKDQQVKETDFPGSHIVPLNKIFDSLDQIGEAEVVVLDVAKGDPFSNLHLLSDLRCRAETRHASIIIHLSKNAHTAGAMAYDLGASDVIFSPLDTEKNRASITQQIRNQEKLRHLKSQLNNGLRLALIDPLTGLFNRRYAMSHLERLTERALESSRELGVMVADIDRFKDVNDTYGHQIGDRVIVAIAKCLKDNLRGADMVARLGGEEFLITMPDTNAKEAQGAAQRLRRAIERLRIPLDDGTTTGVTLSIGLSVQLPQGQTPQNRVEGIIKEADNALFVAKAEGRNQVMMHRSAA